MKDIQDKGFMYVEYANGAKQTLDTYAAMAARSARIESTNIGAIGMALQAGTDLVRMTTMPQCCKLCGAYQDKVYSISGKDKRFPALFKTVLKSGYALPHPNCRHEFIPYFAEAEDPADLERMIKQSRIKYDSKGRLADVRTQRDIELYQAWQAGNRQRNTEMLEYNKMREYYQAKGIDAPYSTLAAFRRARRAQSENYQESRKEWGYKPKESANTQEEQQVPQILVETPLTNAQNSGIVEEQSQETNKEIIAKINNMPKHIHMDLQGKHIIGYKTYDASKSRLNANSVEDANALVVRIIQKYSGTGVFERNRKGEWINREIVETDEIIGFVVNKEGELVPTNIAKIHYSKKGVHIVPTLNTKKGKKK